MRRSRSAPGLGFAPVRAAISRTLSPLPRLKKKGSVMPMPIAAPQARSEFRPSAEAELLDPVVGFLREREGIIEAQRPERGFPNQTHTDRAANVHPIVDRTRHRIGDAWAKGRTDTTRNDLASGGGCRAPAGISDGNPLLINDGFFSRILLRRIKSELAPLILTPTIRGAARLSPTTRVTTQV